MPNGTSGGLADFIEGERAGQSMVADNETDNGSEARCFGQEHREVEPTQSERNGAKEFSWRYFEAPSEGKGITAGERKEDEIKRQAIPLSRTTDHPWKDEIMNWVDTESFESFDLTESPSGP